MIKVYFHLLKFINLEMLDHAQKVVDISIISKVFLRAIFVFEVNAIFRKILLDFMYMYFFEVL
jgi:hypothetical protein